MIFANEPDAGFWTAIIAAICVGVGNIVIQVVQMVLTYYRDIRKEKKLDENTEMTKQAAVKSQQSFSDLGETVNRKTEEVINANHKAATVAAAAALVAAEKVAEQVVKDKESRA